MLDGYDAATGRITDVTRGITLVSSEGEVAAIWRYSGLIEHWQRKHERAVYVPSETRNSPRKQYRYGHQVLLGLGTDFLRFLNAMASGAIYYDPGIKLEKASHAPTVKRRSQFRIKWQNLPSLYTVSEQVSVIDGDSVSNLP